MTKARGIRRPCLRCGVLLYSTNVTGVCVTNPDCRSVQRLLCRRPALRAADVLPLPGNCPCCDAPLTHTYGPTQRTLDRIIPTAGYVSGNVQWLCRRCNFIKNNAEPEELMRVALFVNRKVA